MMLPFFDIKGNKVIFMGLQMDEFYVGQLIYQLPGVQQQLKNYHPPTIEVEPTKNKETNQ